jgi:tripartite-type tricarboxylate transporter receptor subunit TctC
MVAKSPPDGYTIMMGHVSVNAIAPSLFPKLPYDVIKDFAPVTLAASVPHIIVVHPSLPVTNIKELVTYLKARPGKLSFPSAGNGSTPHLAGEMFKSLAGVDIVHVPYKGTGQSMQDLLSGQHLVGFDTMPASAPYVRSGKLRALAVTGPQRVRDFPDLPTVEEAGVPGYQLTTWYGVFAPAGTPPAIVNRLQALLVKATEGAAAKNFYQTAGIEPFVTKPEELAKFQVAESQKWGRIIKSAGIDPE